MEDFHLTTFDPAPEAPRRLEVDEEGDGERLDAWVSKTATMSRAQVQRLIEQSHIQYLGPRRMSRLKPSTRLESGDQLLVTIPPPEPVALLAQPIPLQIVYEDNDLAVLVKPRGMVVHPAAGNHSGTLVNALLAHCKNLSGIGGEIRPGIVHRLDKDTSGLMVVAKNDASHSTLSRQFAGRMVTKEYLALVHGQPATNSTIDMPIGRHPMDRKRMAVVFSGRPAVTEYERIEALGDYALLRLRLRTGRTHQIRVHLAWLGHPVAGDPIYCRRDPLALRGQFLHAAHLGFTHPTSGRPLEFEAALPPDLQATLERVRHQADGASGSGNSLRILDGWGEAASGM